MRIHALPEKPPRRIASVEGPDPVDVHVGGTLARLRRARKVSQKTLADAIGVSFQQVQKYEAGRNRLSASALWRAAGALDVSIDNFFLGL
jgi:transcriptional regulator with XRE-family HTH domain